MAKKFQEFEAKVSPDGQRRNQEAERMEAAIWEAGDIEELDRRLSQERESLFSRE